MKLIKTLLFLSLFLQFNLVLVAQESILERVKPIKIMYLTRADVEKLLGKGEDKDDDFTWYYFKDSTIIITYSDGDCTEGFLAPNGTVVKVDIDFKEERELSELKKKVNLKKLRAVHAYDTNAKEYYDDERGISYYADLSQKLWESITFYPSAEYSQFRCED